MNSWDDYPKWVKILKLFLEDTIIDHIAPDGSEDAIVDKVQDAALAVVCAEYGHCVENDQCMIPGHRFCIICNKPMSSIPVGHYQPEPT